MDSIPLLPQFPLDMDLKISVIECKPKEVLVEFQGQYNAEFEFDYHILQKELQNVPKVKDNVVIGDFCLVEDKNSMEWHRGRIVEKKGEMYEVFLIDTGSVLKADITHIASACGEIFQLPPKIVCGIFSNILPPEEKWSSKAINYFSSLLGIHLKGHVQAILPSQVVLLEVPKVIDDLVKLSLAQYVDRDTFILIVEILKDFPIGSIQKQIPDLLQQKHIQADYIETIPTFQQIVDHLRPCLSVDTTEKVKITAAVSPLQFHCRISPWIQELEHLTSAMFLHYEAISKEAVCDHFGLLCAAKRKDGQWHRGVIQQLLSDDKLKVWFMDFGYSEAVPSKSVHKLEPEFRLLPMMSFPCALSCLSLQNENHRIFQIGEFKRALLGQTILVHVDKYCKEEHLYHVTLHNKNLLIPSPGQHENKLPRLRSPKSPYKIFSNEEAKKICHEKPSEVEVIAPQEIERDLNKNELDLQVGYPRMNMKIDSVYIAYVQYVLNPSNFWVRIDDQEAAYLKMVKNIGEKYAMCEDCDMLLENPQPGMLCCARYSKDMNFYRAVISEVHDMEITVYFLDFGNTETVPDGHVKKLFTEFHDFPAVAMCCTLAHAFSLEEVWVKSATDFFKNAVFGKPLLVHVLGKQTEKYVVDLHLTNTSEEPNVVTLMVQAGYAEYWESTPDCSPLPKAGSMPVSDLKGVKLTKNTSIQIGQMSTKTKQQSVLLKEIGVSEKTFSTPSSSGNIFSKKMITLRDKELTCHYDQHVFKPGSVIEVICSNMCSPGGFWCQLQAQSEALVSLMTQIQIHYSVQGEPYEVGKMACVAKRLVDGKWYRASVIQQISTKEVDVIFIDYGFQERVKVEDLKSITPDFLILEGQAFRCSLYNLVEPLNADPVNWTKEACAGFRCFLDSASSGSLKCTVYSLMLVRPNILCNVVDLETPSHSAKQFLIDKGYAHLFDYSKPLSPSISPFTFMYSSFNIKIGSEEEMYITHIYSPTKFYCQLVRNSETIDALMSRVAQIGNSVVPSRDSSLRLCIAKYFEDGNFYRAIACPMQSSSHLMVYFVDFGNKQVVERQEVVPIPEEATDLIFTPMQALKCYLSGLTDTLPPVEVVKWFEENCLGKILKAVIISREMDGRLSLELYDGCLKINKKVKELMKMHLAYCAEVQEKANSNVITKIKHGSHIPGYVGMDCESEGSKNTDTFQNKDEIKSEGSQYTSNLLSLSTGTDSFNGSFNKTPDSHSSDFRTQFVSTTSMVTSRKFGKSQQECRNSLQPQYTNLPKPNIKSNSEVLGYVSHVNSPSNFYIHLAEDEHFIVQIAEELNSQSLSLIHSKEETFKAGDLVMAEYEKDSALYRAVVKQVKSGEMFDVEFIDYGNSSVLCRSKLYNLPVKFLTTPRLAHPAFLTGIRFAKPDGAAFMANVPNNFKELLISSEPVRFNFVQEYEHGWEVNINCDMTVGEKFLPFQEVLVPENILLSKTKEQSLSMSVLKQSPKVNTATLPDVCDKANIQVLGVEQANVCYIPNQAVPSGQLEKVKLSSISDCGTFYVTLLARENQSTHLSGLIDNAANLTENSLPVGSIKDGIMCLTKSEKSLKWFRAEVKEIFSEEKMMLVVFVDNGRTEKVPMSNAKKLNGNLKSIPKQTVACKWVWLKKTERRFFKSIMNSLTSQVLKILFLRYLKAISTWEVEILVGDVLLMQYSGVAPCPTVKNEPLNLEDSPSVPVQSVHSIPWITRSSGKSYLGFACAATDPFNFFVQLEDSFDIMTELCVLLYDLPDNLPTLPLEQVTPGSHCLMKCDLKEQWCRAEVSDVSADFVLLTFIDFGCSFQVPPKDMDKLRMIPENISCLPRLAYPCTLSEVVPVNLEKWTEKAIHYFQNYLNEKELQIQFKNYQHGLTLDVDISHERSNLADDLIAAGHAVRSKRKTPDFDAPLSTKPSGNSRKPFKMTWAKNNALRLSDIKPGTSKTTFSENSRLDNLKHSSTALNVVNLRDESNTYNSKKDGKRVNCPQQSNKERIQDPAQASTSTLRGLSAASKVITRTNRTQKASGEVW
ncbi:tudor domain-containing protein 15 [Pleurodeles waltl]|uniref:tudor domain-containing protein 15 n=1 Tax=Pleurodeles waltl TaxID=8319 RepID=UPI0037099DA0